MSKTEVPLGVLLAAVAEGELLQNVPQVYDSEHLCFRDLTPHETATVKRYLARQAKHQAYKLICKVENERAERRERRLEARHQLRSAAVGMEKVHQASLKVVQ